MSRRCQLLVLAPALAWAALGTGCRMPAPAPPTPATGADIDPCAERLHDIAGQLLLYYAAHRELPERLDELVKTGSDSPLPLVCPLSGKPYAYSPEGLEVSGWPGRLIVYDAEPCHAGMRWGILAEPPRPGKPLVVRVVRPPESAILWADQEGEP